MPQCRVDTTASVTEELESCWIWTKLFSPCLQIDIDNETDAFVYEPSPGHMLSRSDRWLHQCA